MSGCFMRCFCKSLGRQCQVTGLQFLEVFQPRRGRHAAGIHGKCQGSVTLHPMMKTGLTTKVPTP